MTNDRINNIIAPILHGFKALYHLLRNYFLTGVIVLVPSAVTVFIMVLLFRYADGILGDAVSSAIGYPMPGVGLVATIMVFILVGIFAQNVLGRRFMKWIDYSLESLPVVRSLYVGIKQVSDVILQHNQGEFQRVVMVEYPKEESWAIGFVTGDFPAPATPGCFGGKQMITVFVPTTPNPTSGFLLIIDKSKIIDTSLSIEEAMKMVISGGLVRPGYKPASLQSPPEDFTIPH